jgi:hypothetical protein
MKRHRLHDGVNEMSFETQDTRVRILSSSRYLDGSSGAKPLVQRSLSHLNDSRDPRLLAAPAIFWAVFSGVRARLSTRSHGILRMSFG